MDRVHDCITFCIIDFGVVGSHVNQLKNFKSSKILYPWIASELYNKPARKNAQMFLGCRFRFSSYLTLKLAKSFFLEKLGECGK